MIPGGVLLVVQASKPVLEENRTIIGNAPGLSIRVNYTAIVVYRRKMETVCPTMNFQHIKVTNVETSIFMMFAHPQLKP